MSAFSTPSKDLDELWLEQRVVEHSGYFLCWFGEADIASEFNPLSLTWLTTRTVSPVSSIGEIDFLQAAHSGEWRLLLYDGGKIC